VPDDDAEDNASGVEISDMLEYKQAFQPRRELRKCFCFSCGFLLMHESAV